MGHCKFFSRMIFIARKIIAVEASNRKTALKTFLKPQFPSFDHHCKFLKIRTVIKCSILSLCVLRYSTEGYAKLMGRGALERERKIILKDISLSTKKYVRSSVGGVSPGK